MSKFKSKQVLAFSLEGRFLSFVFEDGYKLKYLRLATSEGEYHIKLAKQIRYSLEMQLTPGDWLQILGEKKVDLKTGKIKLKAEHVERTGRAKEERVDPNSSLLPSAPAPKPPCTSTVPASPKNKASILVCQKSDCMKRGGRAVCHALEAALSDRGLENEVTIKGTGCLKQCKAGPNLVVMPDKTRYSRIQAEQIPALIDKHFPNQTKEEEPEAAESAVASVEELVKVK